LVKDRRLFSVLEDFLVHLIEDLAMTDVVAHVATYVGSSHAAGPFRAKKL
jgi:hypothetical protein